MKIPKIQKLDWIGLRDRAVRQQQDINCVRNHSVRNAAIIHYTGARHWKINFLNAIHYIAHCCNYALYIIQARGIGSSTF